MKTSRLRRPVALTGFGVVALGLLALVSQAHGGVALAQAPVVSNVEFKQIDWFGSQAATIVDSEWGQFSVDITPGASIEYVNVVAEHTVLPTEQWIVRNMPTVPSSSDPSTQRFTTKFDLGLLGVSRGQFVSSLAYFVTVDSAPLVVQPSGTTTVTLVGDVTFDAEGRGAGPHTDPGSPLDLSVLAFGVGPLSFAYHAGVPNHDLNKAADVNGCGPAAAANSLKWLEDTYAEVTIGDPLQTIYNDVNSDMGRGAGATIADSQFLSGKLKYINDKSLPLTVKFQGGLGLPAGNFTTADGTAIRQPGNLTFDFIEQELDRGEDVEVGITWLQPEPFTDTNGNTVWDPGEPFTDTNGNGSWDADGVLGGGHWITLTGKVDIDLGLLGSARGISYKEDEDQDAPGGTVHQSGWLVTRPDGFLELTSEARNRLDFAVSESPIGVGGIVELSVDGSDAPASLAEGSGSSSLPYGAIAGAAAVAAVALAASGWYARRRWMR